MRVTEDSLASAVETFQSAAVGAGPWTTALAALAAVTGSRSGQLIGVGAEAAVPFNWITNLDPAGIDEFNAMNGGDPRLNARVRAGLQAPELQAITEPEFATEDDLRTPVYDLYRRYDILDNCQTTLLRESDLAVGLAVMRTRKQGQISAEQRRAFTVVAPHVRAAVRTQMALQSQGAALVAGSMEALSMAVFVCDGQGRVRAMSPQAEALALSGGHLRLRGGHLTASSGPDTRALSIALRQAAFARSLAKRPATMLMVRSAAEGGEPLLVEVASVPGESHSFGLGVAALVVARSPRRDEARVAMVAKALFGLTQAEAAVVADLVAGLSADAIADRAGVSVETIRSHIKRVFQKAGVRKQIELISLVTARL